MTESYSTPAQFEETFVGPDLPPCLQDWRQWFGNLLAAYPVITFEERPALHQIVRAYVSREDCEHDWELVWQTFSNGTKHFTQQCRKCWKTLGRNVKSADFDDEEVANAPELRKLPWDHFNPLTLYMETAINERARESWYEGGKEEWRDGYQEYLKTPHWQDLRARVLARDRNVCTYCLKARATHVHHTSSGAYTRLGMEDAWVDLRSVCKECHDRLSDKLGHGR